MTITHVDPPSLHSNPAFTWGVVAEGRQLFVGGQNGTGPDGSISGGLAEQSRQAFLNLLAVLEEAGTDQDHVVKLTILLADGQDVVEGYQPIRDIWHARTTVTTLKVAGFARPEALVEIEAVAVVPD